MDVAAAPALTEAGARGVAARIKSAIGAAVTVKVAVAEWVSEPPVAEPSMVTV